MADIDPALLAEYTRRLAAHTAKDSVDEQKKLFQSAFASEFAGRFRELDVLADAFKDCCSDPGPVQHMQQFEALQFLRKRGEGKTARELSDALKTMDYDQNGTLSFIAYLLFTYKKSVVDLFSADPISVAKVDLSEVDAAIDLEKKLLAERQSVTAEMEALRAIVNAGGPGSAKANLRLRQLELANPANAVKAEMDAIVGRLRAVKTLPRDTISDEALAAKRAFEDQRKLAEKMAQEEKGRVEMEKQAARERLAAKSARFAANNGVNSSADEEAERRRQIRAAEMAAMLGKNLARTEKTRPEMTTNPTEEIPSSAHGTAHETSTAEAPPEASQETADPGNGNEPAALEAPHINEATTNGQSPQLVVGENMYGDDPEPALDKKAQKALYKERKKSMRATLKQQKKEAKAQRVAEKEAVKQAKREASIRKKSLRKQTKAPDDKEPPESPGGHRTNRNDVAEEATRESGPETAEAVATVEAVANQ